MNFIPSPLQKKWKSLQDLITQQWVTWLQLANGKWSWDCHIGLNYLEIISVSCSHEGDPDRGQTDFGPQK